MVDPNDHNSIIPANLLTAVLWYCLQTRQRPPSKWDPTCTWFMTERGDRLIWDYPRTLIYPAKDGEVDDG